jgi:hypothetical protein
LSVKANFPVEGQCARHGVGVEYSTASLTADDVYEMDLIRAALCS